MRFILFFPVHQGWACNRVYKHLWLLSFRRAELPFRVHSFIDISFLFTPLHKFPKIGPWTNIVAMWREGIFRGAPPANTAVIYIKKFERHVVLSNDLWAIIRFIVTVVAKPVMGVTPSSRTGNAVCPFSQSATNTAFKTLTFALYSYIDLFTVLT